MCATIPQFCACHDCRDACVTRATGSREQGARVFPAGSPRRSARFLVRASRRPAFSYVLLAKESEMGKPVVFLAAALALLRIMWPADVQANQNPAAPGNSPAVAV